MNCINDIFPPELMQKIFQHLESKDLFQILNVCKYWKDIILEHNEVDLHIGGRSRSIWKDYDGPPFLPIEDTRKFRAQRAFISKLENPNEELSPRIQSEFWRKPDLLRYLWIDGYLQKATFNKILIGLSNLQKLEIHFNTLTSLNPRDNSSVSFQSLVNLKDFSIRIFSKELNRYKGISFVDVIGIFNSAKFPNLEYINLSFPTRPHYQSRFSQLIGSVNHFVIEHKSTLKGLKIFIGNYGGLGYMFVESRPPGAPITSLTGQKLNLLKLKSIEIHSIHSIPTNADPLFDWMMDLVNAQRNLEVMHCSVQYLSLEQIQHSLPHFAQTIKVIQLVVNTITQPPVDLNVFSICPNLRKLELKGVGRGDGIKNYDDGERIQDEDVELIGGRLISKNLEVLSLIDLYISTKDITEILQDQKNLKELRLVYIGMVENFGVSFDTFIRLVSERNAEKMFFRNSINLENVFIEPNEISGINIKSILNYENKDNEKEISLRLDGENYIQIEEDPYGQMFPDGNFFPNFVIHEAENGRRDEFHETPPGFNCRIFDD